LKCFNFLGKFFGYAIRSHHYLAFNNLSPLIWKLIANLNNVTLTDFEDIDFLAIQQIKQYQNQNNYHDNDNNNHELNDKNKQEQKEEKKR